MAKVLIVDDDPSTVELLSMAVQLQGHSAVPAFCGSDAIERLQEQPVDIVLLDLMMPVMDGIETLETIRTLDGCSNVPVVLVTASTDDDLERKTREAGGNGVLRKPVGMDVLASEIDRLVEIT